MEHTAGQLSQLNRQLGALLNVRRCQTGQKAAATQRKIDALYATILRIEQNQCLSEDPNHPGLFCSSTTGHGPDHYALGYRWFA